MDFARVIQRVVGRRGRGSVRARDAAIFDVTAFSTEIDLEPLEVVRWAPCWMTRAERLLLYTLAFTLRPRRYLEIGTYRGGSALIVAAAMDALGTDGRLVCVDTGPQVADEHWDRIRHRATMLVGASPAILPRAAAAAGGRFDLALVDGDHSYGGVTRDVRAVLGHLADGAYLLCHDGYNDDVAAGLRDVLAEAGDEVVDCGLLTREVTHEPGGNEKMVRWGGLRLLRIRPD